MKHPIDADEADFVAAFYSTLDVLKDPSNPPWNLKAWSESPDVQPLEAARILNGRSPTYEPADEDSHIIEMAALFVAHAGVVPKAFRLSDWVAIVDSAELKHDEDIAAYLEFRAQENAAAMAEAAPTPDKPEPLESLSQMQPQPDPQSPPALPESKEVRQAKRWALCVEIGLAMPTDTYKGMPRGIGKVAQNLGITRQALTQDLRAHAERIFGK